MLKVNNIGGKRSKGNSTIRNITRTDSVSYYSNNSDSISYPAMNFGDPAQDRYMFVIINAKDFSSTDDNSNWSEVTIGGETATIVVEDEVLYFEASYTGYGGSLVPQVESGGAHVLAYALVPDGTDGTVTGVISNHSGTMSRWDIDLYRVTGLGNTTPSSSSSGTTGTTLNVSNNGFGFIFGIDGAYEGNMAISTKDQFSNDTDLDYGVRGAGVSALRTVEGNLTHNGENYSANSICKGVAFEFTAFE